MVHTGVGINFTDGDDAHRGEKLGHLAIVHALGLLVVEDCAVFALRHCVVAHFQWAFRRTDV